MDKRKYVWLRSYYRCDKLCHSWQYLEDDFKEVFDAIKFACAHDNSDECDEHLIEQWIFNVDSNLEIDKLICGPNENLFVCKELVFGDTSGAMTWHSFSNVLEAKDVAEHKATHIYNTMVFRGNDCLLHWKNKRRDV